MKICSNDPNDLNDPNYPNDPNDPNDWMTGSFADDYPYDILTLLILIYFGFPTKELF